MGGTPVGAFHVRAVLHVSTDFLVDCQRRGFALDVEDVLSDLPRSFPVSASQMAWTWDLIKILVAEIEPWRRDRAVDHGLGPLEEVLVVVAGGRAVREHQRGLSAAACSATALGVVGGRRRDVAQVHHVQLGDVHAQFHGGRAVENGQLALAEIGLALLALRGGDLGGVLPRLQPDRIEGVAAVEGDKERVGAGAVLGRPGHAQWVQPNLAGRRQQSSHRKTAASTW